MAVRSKASTLSRCLLPARPLIPYSSARFNSTASDASSYPLYPSVAQLLHEQNIPSSDIPKIPTTGPSGRLLKGDVLAYIGSIPSDYPSNLASKISKLSHLDLSNIKIAAPPAPPPPPQSQPQEQQQQAEAETQAAEESAEPTSLTIALPISFSKIISIQKKIRRSTGVNIPLTSFVSRAADIANDDLPKPNSQYAPPSKQQVANDLFDEILGSSSRQHQLQHQHQHQHQATSRGDYIPEIASAVDYYGERDVKSSFSSASASTSTSKSADGDVIDILSGRVSAYSSPPSSSSKSKVMDSLISTAEEERDDPSTSIFSLTIPETEGIRAQAFLDRMQSLIQDEPGRLLVF